MQRMVRVLLAAAVTAAFGVGVVAASPTAASAATPVCNAEHYFASTSGDFNVYAPAYKSGSSYTKVCTLSEGKSGDGVASLQVALNQCYHFSLAVDGSFGQQTSVAVLLVQSSAKITADGIYGNQTRKAMLFPRADDNPNDLECGRLS